MEKMQQREWTEAQKIVFSVDLVEAAKKHLKFLATVDRNRYLYEDHALQRSIYRYNAFWLPLLAKHSESPVIDGQLVVPLDCEWIWHCHRLNPIRYKLDCENLFGRVLDNCNVVSSIDASSNSTTEEIWNKMYPDEPYELHLTRPISVDILRKNSENEKFTSYNLAAAVKRQIPFTFQVSRPYMSDDLFVQEAVDRYKAFLYLIVTNRKKNSDRLCVPTVDIDLIWHTHQLYPVSYTNDLCELLGKLVPHNDDEPHKSKLRIRFSETRKQWDETFGTKYWKAGTLNRGTAPDPVTDVPYKFSPESCKKFNFIENRDQIIQFPAVEAVEVSLEFAEVKNVPDECIGNLIIRFSKKQCDRIFKTQKTMNISSEYGGAQTACFQCEPTGEFLFELISCSPSTKQTSKSMKLLGSCSLSLQDLLATRSQLSTEKWLTVDPGTGGLGSCPDPILLHTFISFTPPTPAPRVIHLKSRNFGDKSCFLSLPTSMKIEDSKSIKCVLNDDRNEIFFLQMRNNNVEDASKKLYYITKSGDQHKLAEYFGDHWSIMGTHGSLKLLKNAGDGDHLFELIGYKPVKLYCGRKLEFVNKNNKECQYGRDFMTAVEFSPEFPYGKAAALIDMEMGTLKAMDEWIVMPGIALTYILSDIHRNKKSSDSAAGGKVAVKGGYSSVSCAGHDGVNIITANDAHGSACCDNCVDG